MASNKQEAQQIDLTKLNLQQLTQLKQQLDQELTMFQESIQTLKLAQTKFQESKENLEKITPSTKGNSIMVPLTGSMYVPGQIANVETVLVDVGTGYYLQKDIAGAKDYFKRRVAFVTDQMEKIQAMGLEKSKIRDAIMDVMEMKVQAQMASQRRSQAGIKT